MKDLSQIRTCIQQVLPHQERLLNDIYKSPDADKLSAAFFAAKLWDADTVITIGFLEMPDKIEKTSIDTLKQHGQGPMDPLQYLTGSMPIIDMIKKIILERFQPLVNLKFQFVDSNPENAMIRISFKPRTASSLVGTDALNQTPGLATMNLGWFDVPTVMHEFCHAIGMIHEHQNPRNNPIKWNKENVYAWTAENQHWSRDETNTNFLDTFDVDSINGSDFDPQSIMLYFIAPQLTLNGVGIPQNLRLSGNDVVWINSSYTPKNGETPAQFYQRVYSDNIDESIILSAKLAKKVGMGRRIAWKQIGIVLGCIIGVIVLILLITGLRARAAQHATRVK